MWRCFVRDQARVPSVAGAGSSLFRKTEQFFFFRVCMKNEKTTGLLGKAGFGSLRLPLKKQEGKNSFHKRQTRLRANAFSDACTRIRARAERAHAILVMSTGPWLPTSWISCRMRGHSSRD